MSEKLSERLEALAVEAGYEGLPDDQKTLREAAAALRAVEGAAWIPCSERLPERDGLGAVLAFDKDRPRKGIWLETTHPSWWGQFMEETNEFGPTITHWRPLPDAPLDAAGSAEGVS